MVCALCRPRSYVFELNPKRRLFLMFMCCENLEIHMCQRPSCLIVYYVGPMLEIHDAYI